MKKILLLLLSSIVVLALLLQQWVGFDIIWNVMLSIDPVLVPFIIILPFMTLLVYSYRWRFLLRSVEIDADVPVVFRYALIGAVFNYITPMLRFGGEPVKGYMLAKHMKTHKRRVFASLAMDSVITFISLLGLVYFAALSLSFFNILDWFTLWAILTVVLMPLTMGSYVVYDKRVLDYISRNVESLASKIRPGAGRGLPHDMMRFRENVKTSLQRKDLLAKSLLIGISERLMEIFTLYIIFASLGVEIGIVECVIVLGVGILAGGIPFLPGGLVVYESSTIFVLTLLGVNFAPATSAILIWRFVSYWLVIIVGIIYSWFYGISFSLRKKQHFFKFGA
jgi:uncharacterized protein (TIRG00374 family)